MSTAINSYNVNPNKSASIYPRELQYVYFTNNFGFILRIKE